MHLSSGWNRLRLPGQSVSNLEAIRSRSLPLGGVDRLVAGVAAVDDWLTAPVHAAGGASPFRLPFAVWRMNAWHMVGRLAFGLAVFIVTVNGICTPARVRAVMIAAVLTGVVVGTLTILEYQRVGVVLRWLLTFRPSVSFVGAQVRAGGTLQYATIASMYLEIVFALALGLCLVALDAKRVVAVAALGIGLLVMAEAITLTFTRAGLVTVATSLALAGIIRYRQRGVDRGVRLVALLSVVIVGLFATSRSSQAMWLRLTSAGQESWYRAVVDAPEELTLRTGATVTVPVRVANAGRLTWDSSAFPPVYFSYHWLQENADRVVLFEGIRTPFAAPVPPQSTTLVQALVRAPRQPGRYRLAWDVVQEGQLWFISEPGSTLTFSHVIVSGPPLDDGLNQPTSALPRAAVRPGRLVLWRAAAAMFAEHPVFGVGADNFRLLYGPYAGLANADPRIHSNNMYIEVLVGGGLVGGASFLWLLWRAAGRFADGVRVSAAARSSEAIGIVAAGVAILLHGLVDSFLSFTPTNILIAITLGLAVTSTDGAETGQDADRI